jgi:hypothetical protein
MRAEELNRNEVLAAAIGSVVIAVVMTWPLVLDLGTVAPRDIGDPLAIAWQPAWGGHALLNQPLDFFDANRFWPIEDSLAFGDALIGYAPTGIIGEGPKDAIVRYDLLFVFSYALTFFGAYLLAREIGIGAAGATVAGMAFAFAPFRLEQDGHMQVIASGGIPLSLAFAVRGIREREPWWLFAAWIVAAWQVSLGFVLGLPFAYGLAAASLAAIVVWLVKGRPPILRRMLFGGIAGAIAFVGICGFIARPYLEIADQFPEAKREQSEVAGFSGDPEAFITAPRESFVWGDATEGIREGLENIPEKTLFPGALILVLALSGWAHAASTGAFGSAWGWRRSRSWCWSSASGRRAARSGPIGSSMSPAGLGCDPTPGRLATFSRSRSRCSRRRGRRRRSGPFAGTSTRPGSRGACGDPRPRDCDRGRSLPFDPFDDQAMPRCPTSARRPPTSPPRSSICRRRPPSTTAPTSSPPPRASTTSSTAGRAPTPTRFST